MVKIELSKAKEELSTLISLVCKGERVIIIKNNKPVADLVKHEMKNERKLGLLRGRLSIPENFNDEDEEINSMFYGKQS
jgi:antitoxin (DNA-binding transcriptional repressor) of toxin-antitoxin stability system